jgi:ABC-type lipoprotein release transport system permease subunit
MRQSAVKWFSLWYVAVENLFRYKQKTLSMLCPLVLVLAVFAVMVFVRDGLRNDAELSLDFIPDLTVQKLVGGRIERIDLSACRALESWPEVKEVVPRVWGYVPISVGNNKVAYTLMGVDVKNASIQKNISIALEKGRFLTPQDSDKTVVGKAVAEGFGIEEGDTIQLTDAMGFSNTYEVVGIFATPVQIYTSDLFLMRIEDARRFFGYSQNEASDICINLHNPIQSGAVAQKIATSYPSLRVLSKDALSDLIDQAFGGRAGIFQIFWLVLLITVVLISWNQASNVSLEMRREIGILKAVGWSISDVIVLKLMESLAIGVFSVLAGIVLGMIYTMLGAPVVKNYFIGWSSVYPNFPIPMSVTAANVFLVSVIGIFPLLAATIVPAWLVGIIEPDKAIRG